MSFGQRVHLQLRFWVRMASAALLGFSGQSLVASETSGCGKVIAITTRGGSITRYSLGYPLKRDNQNNNGSPTTAVLVLLPGGGGHIDLDEKGCARQLKGNWLVRSHSLFQKLGFYIALVDASSDYFGEDGLGGFRQSSAHAEDLGKIVEDLRARLQIPIIPVWLVGTSRGSISAVNAMTLLSGSKAPDGLVITSVITVGKVGGKKPWVSQTVFDLPLEKIRKPVLVIGHSDDRCIRSPSQKLPSLMDRISDPRKQLVVLQPLQEETSKRTLPPVSEEACSGRSPHGFFGLEEKVNKGIASFIWAGKYE